MSNLDPGIVIEGKEAVSTAGTLPFLSRKRTANLQQKHHLAVTSYAQ